MTTAQLLGQYFATAGQQNHRSHLLTSDSHLPYTQMAIESANHPSWDHGANEPASVGVGSSFDSKHCTQSHDCRSLSQSCVQMGPVGYQLSSMSRIFNPHKSLPTEYSERQSGTENWLVGYDCATSTVTVS